MEPASHIIDRLDSTIAIFRQRRLGPRLLSLTLRLMGNTAIADRVPRLHDAADLAPAAFRAALGP